MNGYWPEPWLEPDAAYQTALQRGLARFAAFLEAEKIEGKVSLG